MLSFDISLLSKYRGAMMGVSILGVMIGHGLIWSNISESSLIMYLRVICWLSFTQGFLFFSGLGLCYSLRNSSRSIRGFYKRRIKRLLIPFMLMTLPFYIWYEFVETGRGISFFLLDWTSLYFWFYGNNDMWYISISVLLYALFPLFYGMRVKLLGESKWLIYCFVSIVMLLVLYLVDEDYYKMTAIGLAKVPIFFLGAYVGIISLTKQKKVNVIKVSAIMLPIVLLMLYLRRENELLFADLQAITVRLITIPLCCYILYIIDCKCSKLSYLKNILNWLGKYSLEIYVIHMMLHTLLSSCWVSVSPLINTFVVLITTLIIVAPLHVFILKISNKVLKYD